MQLLQIRTRCAFLFGMAHLLGTLAARAAEHWKRSLAIVAVVLVALGVAAGAGGGSFVDDFRTPGTESQSAIDLLAQALSGGVGRYRERRLRGGVGHASRARATGRDRADDRGDPRPAARDGRAEPVRQGQWPALRGRAHRLRAGPVRRHRRRARQGAGRAARAGVRARRARRVSRCPATGRSWTRPSRPPPRSAS